MTTSIQPRIDVQDRAELTDLVSRLGACLDEHRFVDLRQLFVDDVTATTPGGTVHGIDDVVAQATRNHVDFNGLMHRFTNVLADVDGDTASVRANAIGRFLQDGRIVREVGGVYRMGARRTEDGWRIARLEMALVWRTDE